MDLEKKILGEVEEKKADVKALPDYLTAKYTWEVSNKECGKTIFSGLMVKEMLDTNLKSAIRGGKKEVEYNGFKFKLAK